MFIAALWSPAWKGLTSGLLFVMFKCVIVTFPCGILGKMWYTIVAIPDLCCLSYLKKLFLVSKKQYLAKVVLDLEGALYFWVLNSIEHSNKCFNLSDTRSHYVF